MENSSNKRLAKNTLFLYIRMILIMLVSLYTSRIVLEELGVDDYGVYTVVGGVVAMFAFINGSMTSSTQRFLNFELGKGVTPRLSKLFRTALTIHALIGVVMLILAETVGLWFVNAKLVIPADSLIGANVVYQTSVLSFCITIMQVPFNATIIAHEKMSIYAYISIIEVLLKLSIAVSLMIVPTHKLAIYGVLILVVHFITASIYAIYCLRKYSECSLRFCYDRDMFKEMSGFAGWNLCGSIAWIVRLQGMGIILNIFFGPVLNAAKGISDQVAGAVNQLNNNFQVALNPQITKSYAQEKLQEMEVLTYRGIKFSSLLLLVMIVPLSININFILNLWLTTVPDYTPIFVILILADVLSGNLFGSPLMASLSATGKIRNYQIIVSAILLMILPVAYLLLKSGFAPESIFYANIVLNIIAGITRFQFCRKQLGYSFATFTKSVVLPVIMVSVLSSTVMIVTKHYLFAEDNIFSFCVTTVTGIAITMATGWYLAFSQTERAAIVNLAKKIYNNKIRNGKSM